MTPEERQIMGPALNGLKATITDAIAARKEIFKRAGIDQRLATETVDVTLPVRPSPVRSRPHSSDQPGH